MTKLRLGKNPSPNFNCKMHCHANFPPLSALEPTAVLGAMQGLHDAQAAGIFVAVEGDDVVVEAPAPTSPELLSHLDHHKVAILALLRPKEDGWNALDYHGLYEDCVRINETEGDLSREEAEAKAYNYCFQTWLVLNPVMLLDSDCPHCTAGAESCLLPCDEAWIHENCESAWSEARKAEAADDDLGSRLDWAPPFSPGGRCIQCGEEAGNALYYGESYGVHEKCAEALSQARQAQATAALSAMGLLPPADTEIYYDLAVRGRGGLWRITIRKGFQKTINDE